MHNYQRDGKGFFYELCLKIKEFSNTINLNQIKDHCDKLYKKIKNGGI